MQKTEHSPKSHSPARKRIGKVALVTGLTLLTGGVGYYFWQRNQTKKLISGSSPANFELPDSSSQNNNPAPTQPPVPAPQTSYRPDTTFPISIYTKGSKVKALQMALKSRYGANISSDSYWGTKTTKALQNAGLPTTLSESQYQQIIGSGTKSYSLTDYRGAAMEILSAGKASVSDLSGSHKRIMAILRRMKTPADYKAVRDIIKGKLGYSLVDVMLNDRTRWTSSQKAKAKAEFDRMGLVYHSSTDKWSMPGGLRGIDGGTHAVSIRDTQVWDESGFSSSIPPGTLIGTITHQEEERTLLLLPSGKRVYAYTEDLILQ